MQNYELLGAIGQGQYGTAYKARHKLDGQLYCIKRIALSAKEDQTGALKEVQLLAQLDHPNIIAYKESCIDPKDGALCIVTSFCEEGDLFNRIRKRQAANQPFSETEVMDMFVQIASALAHIHSKRILHRDLKTQNIFLAKGNIIKLGDFGISKVLEKTDQFATTVTGTPYYMAPEICTNQPYTFKSDIWSLGCVLYELCTLKHAFAADSLLSLVYQIVRGNFPPIPPQQFSSGLSGLVNTLLVRDMTARPSLSQIFAMPYVNQHLVRYHDDQKRSLIRHSNTMAKRRLMMERTLQQQGSNGSTASSGMGFAGDVRAIVTSGQVAGGGDDDGNLTPKERLARKKEAERKRREMELQVANINNTRERGVAAQRKAADIAGSNVAGLPRAGTPAGRPGMQHQNYSEQQYSSAGPGTVRDAWASGSHAAAATAARMDASRAQGHGRGDDTFVNMDTMPNMGTMPTSNHPANQTLYQAYEDRPIKGTARAGGPAHALQQNQQQEGYGDDDDSVLMGTGAGGWGNTLVNMGTMNLGPGGHTAAKTATSSGNRGHAAAAHGLPQRPATSPIPAAAAPVPVVPSNIVAGFKFGLTNPGAMPVLPSFPSSSPPRGASPPVPASPQSRPLSPQVADKVKFGISSDSQPRGSFEYVIKAARSSDMEPRDMSPQRTSPAYGSAAAGAYSEYESDFEEYDSSTEGDQDTINTRVKMLTCMEGDLEASRGRGSNLAGALSAASAMLAEEEALAQVHDTVGAAAKGSKAAVLRDKCQAALGHHFPAVYAYLRRTRSQNAVNTDESEVQRALLELVGGAKPLLQGCFLVDQLVFTESMYR